MGGAEVQQCHLARGLAQRGYRVSMVCMDHGQEDGVVVDGIRVLKAHTPAGGLPVLRFVYPRFTSVWRALRRSNADVYYQRGGGVHTAYAAAFCRRHERTFIYAAASNADFYPDLPYIRYARDRVLFRWGLRRAHVVVVQNPTQLAACRQNLNIPVTLIKSGYVPPGHMRTHAGHYVLWVASLRDGKRPEWFIELARRLPHCQFRMVGGADSPDYERHLRQVAAPVANLELVGFVPYADIEQHFDGARLFVNTSRQEGFPNTYLQAWARGIPTVGTVAIGDTRDGAPVGIEVHTLDELTETVAQLMQDDQARELAGARCLACFEEQHSLTAVLHDYTSLMETLITERSAKVP
ncbi:MAG: glycosyltransferase family 4 protein [Acidiferrobacteraceae bacterium]